MVHRIQVFNLLKQCCTGRKDLKKRVFNINNTAFTALVGNKKKMKKETNQTEIKIFLKKTSIIVERSSTVFVETGITI